MATKSKTNWTSYVKKMAETFQPTWRNNKPGQSRKVTIQLEVPVEGAKHNGFVMAVVDGKPDRETRLPLANFDDDIGAVIKLLCDYVRDEK